MSNNTNGVSISLPEFVNKDDVIDGSAYIHCDWGWGGSCNGYYSGAVFNAGNYNFSPSNFFALKRTH
ncbi:MAG TPA: hypothetical protein DEQ27_05375 [Prevotella sp.]|nr:hypothetical protein [Prevotella sp.]